MQIFIDGSNIGVQSDHFLRPMGLTISELKALELGLAVMRSECPPDETAIIDKTRERLRKVVTKLPHDHDDIELRHAEAAPTEGLTYLGDLRTALRDHQKASITYRRSGTEQPSVRTVRIYAIVPASGMWYAIAYCETSQDLRVFRMDRVESATLLGDRYEIPANFSVSETLQKGKGLKAEGVSSGITVRYSPRIARWIAEREMMSPAEDGSLIVEHPLADEEWGMRHVLQYGPDAELVEPVVVRHKLRERLNAIVNE
jgi:predicted DNA-binding transcriptional regulator YafY